MKRTAVIAVAIAAGLALTACSGGDNTVSFPDPTITAEPSTPSAAATAATGDSNPDSRPTATDTSQSATPSEEAPLPPVGAGADRVVTKSDQGDGNVEREWNSEISIELTQFMDEPTEGLEPGAIPPFGYQIVPVEDARGITGTLVPLPTMPVNNGSTVTVAPGTILIPLLVGEAAVYGDGESSGPAVRVANGLIDLEGKLMADAWQPLTGIAAQPGTATITADGYSATVIVTEPTPWEGN